MECAQAGSEGAAVEELVEANSDELAVSRRHDDEGMEEELVDVGEPRTEKDESIQKPGRLDKARVKLEVAKSKLSQTRKADHKAFGRSKAEAQRLVDAREFDFRMATAEVQQATEIMKDTRRTGKHAATLASEYIAAANWQAAARPPQRQEA